MSSRKFDDAEDSRADEQISAMEGDLSLPRQNGELVFSEPWEARAFGVAVALNEAGVYPWQAFSTQLAEEIAGVRGTEQADDYYARWLGALEALAERTGLVEAEELECRVREYVSGERNDDDH
jgi:nitrile hydratase accessory protein